MARNLDPKLVAFEGRLERGAILRIDPPGEGANADLTGKVLRFQYNPETITRSRTGKWEPRKKRKGIAPPSDIRSQSGTGSSGLMAESETISLKVVFDATEAVLANRGNSEKGVLPELAFLELSSLGREGKEQERGSTFEAIQPVRPDELLLILGRARIFPVVITNISIVEQKFLPTLIPLRAEVDLKFNVLEPTESAYRVWINAAFEELRYARVTASGLAEADTSAVRAVADALQAAKQRNAARR